MQDPFKEWYEFFKSNFYRILRIVLFSFNSFWYKKNYDFICLTKTINWFSMFFMKFDVIYCSQDVIKKNVNTTFTKYSKGDTKC
jgi:hypothetical protein